MHKPNSRPYLTHIPPKVGLWKNQPIFCPLFARFQPKFCPKNNVVIVIPKFCPIVAQNCSSFGYYNSLCPNWTKSPFSPKNTNLCCWTCVSQDLSFWTKSQNEPSLPSRFQKRWSKKSKLDFVFPSN